jgi:hypothetical protein
VLSARIAAIIVSCAALLPFFLASSANALPIDSTLDSVLSVTQLSETNTTTANQDRRRSVQCSSVSQQATKVTAPVMVSSSWCV